MHRIVTATIDARPLALARILVGTAAISLALEWFGPLWKTASGDYLSVPTLSWLPQVTPWFALTLVVVALLAGAAMIVGLAAPWSAGLVSATSAAALLADQQTYSNHLLLLVILSGLIAWSGAGAAWTIRNYYDTRQVPYWPAFLIKVQITTLYAWTAIAKINPDYLSGAVLEVNLRGWVHVPAELLPALAVATIVVEAFLAVALWVPGVRVAALVMGVGLHISIPLMLIQPAPLIPFAVLMFAGYAIVAADAWPGLVRKPARELRRA